MTVAELRQALADKPDTEPVHVLIPGDDDDGYPMDVTGVALTENGVFLEWT